MTVKKTSITTTHRVGYPVLEHYENFDLEINFPPRIYPLLPALNPTNGSLYHRANMPGYWELEYWFKSGMPSSKSWIQNNAFTDVFISPEVLSNRVDAKLRGKIGNLSLSLADSIGEYKESIGLVQNAGKLIQDFWQLRRGRIPPRWAALTRKGLTRKWSFQDVSSAWVAKQFAIEPVIGLLHDSMDQFRKPKRTLMIPIRSAENIELKKGFALPRSVAGNYLRGISTLRQREMHQLILEVDDTQPNFSLGNPLEWVWAATPFSFVIDWFLGVGSFLEQLNPIPSNVKILAGTRVKVIEKHAIAPPQTNGIPTSQGGIMFTYPGGYHYDRTIIRTSDSSLTFPPLPSLHLVNRDSANGILVTTMALFHAMRK